MATVTTVTWRDLRENLADIINRVRYANERVQITRHGKVVAELIPTLHGAIDPHGADGPSRSNFPSNGSVHHVSRE
jgi:prevent-host-death family protein